MRNNEWLRKSWENEYDKEQCSLKTEACGGDFSEYVEKLLSSRKEILNQKRRNMKTGKNYREK